MNYIVPLCFVALASLSLACAEKAQPDKPDAPVADSEAPTWPDGSAIRVVEVGRTHVALNWSPATDNVSIDHYRIFVGGKQVREARSTTCQLNLLEPGVTHALTVQAVDTAGNASGDGLSTQATTRAVVSGAPR